MLKRSILQKLKKRCPGGGIMFNGRGTKLETSERRRRECGRRPLLASGRAMCCIAVSQHVLNLFYSVETYCIKPSLKCHNMY